MNALEICEANAKLELVKRETRREDFPQCAAWIDDLVAAGFKPRVIWMREGEREWKR